MKFYFSKHILNWVKCGDHFWVTRERLILFGSSKLCIIIRVLRCNLRTRMPFSSLTTLLRPALHPSFGGRKHTLNTGVTRGCWASFCSLMDFTSSFLSDALVSLALSLHPNSQQHWQSLPLTIFALVITYMAFPENILKYARNTVHFTKIWGLPLGLHYSCRWWWQGPDIFLNICVSYFFHGYGKIPANINLKWEGFVLVCNLRMQSIMADKS